MKLITSYISHTSMLICCLFFLTIISCDDFEIIKKDVISAQEIKNEDTFIAPLTIEEGSANNVKINDQAIFLEDGSIILQDAGFYSISINDSKPNQFVLFDKNRMSNESDSPEWGLKAWTPALPVMTDEAILQFDLIHPMSSISTIATPFIVRIKNWSVHCSTNATCNMNNQTNFLLKNGIASASLKLSNLPLPIFIGNNEVKLDLPQNTNQEVKLAGDISDHKTIENNSIVHITSDVNILNTGSLTISEGAILIIDKGVNIYNNGPIYFNGTKQNPILVTCSNSDSYFGGFISTGDISKIKASHTFFTRFSYNGGGEFSYGHANHQALFKCENSEQQFDYCYFFDSPGQVFYSNNSILNLNHIIVQRVKTTGQFTDGNVSINDSYFSDFPNDSQEYIDNDNDGIYLKAVDATISNSMIMYAKDDGIDTGGSKGGNVSLTNCVLEACFHEGIAMSSEWPTKKTHTITGCKITNCQQGIELGYSSPNHKVIIDDCDISDNYIGVRYGDNYDRKTQGKMTLRNSTLSNNEKNTWNMVRRNWKPNTSNFIFENNVFE